MPAEPAEKKLEEQLQELAEDIIRKMDMEDWQETLEEEKLTEEEFKYLLNLDKI